MKTSILYFLFLLACIPAGNSQPPAQPILRIENGMHTASATKISVDTAGKYLLTCSEDKTARLWNASDGQLLNTLRVPIGSGDEGMLKACALSADGTLAALGGRTGMQWDTNYSIYILNTQTGSITHRISGLSNVILDLQFSPDGQSLAVALAGGGGVRIFETISWSEVKRLQGNNADISWMDFDKNNRLAVAAGTEIWLYNKQFEIIKDYNYTNQIRTVAFNHAADLFGAIYSDTLEISRGKDMKRLYETTGVFLGGYFDHAETLAFSIDGGSIYTGGVYKREDSNKVEKYALSTWSAYGRLGRSDGHLYHQSDIPLMKNSIIGIKTLPNGNIAVLGIYPEIALLSPAGKVLWYKCAGTIRYRYFETDSLGARIYATRFFGEETWWFDITKRALLQKSSFSTFDRRSEEWIYENRFLREPINPLLEQNEFGMRNVTENDTLYLLTNKHLYKFNRILSDFKNKWEMVWKTNLSSYPFIFFRTENHKTLIVVQADGTIRWYNTFDGKELLAYYLESDMKRWVLFTPSGYYDASPGGEDILGWHINNGKDEAPSFYPVSRFKQQYYRPDIIDAAFNTGGAANKGIPNAISNSKKPNSAPAIIKEKLPPLITITEPASGTTVSTQTVRITYSVKTPDDAKIKTIKVLINGRPVIVNRGVVVQASNNTSVSVNIPPADCTITLLAENDNGTSPEANLFIKYRVGERTNDNFVIKPNLYLLAIGISDYQNPDYRLNFAAIDANSFTAEIEKQKGKLYQDIIVRSLIDKNATRENLQDGLQWIQDQTSQKDIAMIFYAGHGVNDNNGIFYMMPAGADANKLRSTCLNFEELKQTVTNIAGKVVVFIDACHSGNVMGGANRRNITDINAVVNELSNSENGAVTFTSSTGKEYSLEDAKWKHGAFTKALLEGLDGKAAVPGKNKITVKSLDAFISERVKELTEGKQHPTSVVPPNVPDFPIAAW